VEPQRAEHFAYFMIRVRRGSLASAEGTLTGLVEQLATGEKESFASAEELIRIICRWPVPEHRSIRFPPMPLCWAPSPSPSTSPVPSGGDLVQPAEEQTSDQQSCTSGKNVSASLTRCRFEP
jgi:hypothetical protein